ncbi:hypothetical protein K438DRAFT_1775486 [Mycena galopus ATCC 62051]|nr:hypothetical protein K438DRAFT_1775486 [Mycena galopus ATCC 62051]
MAILVVFNNALGLCFPDSMPNELIGNALSWHATCPSKLPGLVVRIDFGEATTSTVMHLIATNASMQYAQYIVATHTRHLTATAHYSAIRCTIPLSRIMQQALHATRFLEGAVRRAERRTDIVACERLK